MARIELVELADFAPELRAQLRDPDDEVANGHLRVIAHLPEVANAWLSFLGALKSSGTLSRRLVEIIRLRIAFHNQCAHCMAVRFGDGVADGVTEELVCTLNRPEEAPDLTEADRAALRYADALCNNHLAIGDEMFDQLRVHFSEREVVELSINCAIFLGFGRASRGWQVTDGLPEAYQGSDETMQLAGDGIVVAGGHGEVTSTVG
jgi:AhpD family alkylhydroperoxidase